MTIDIRYRNSYSPVNCKYSIASMSPIHFTAPWPMSLKRSSLIGGVFLVALATSSYVLPMEFAMRIAVLAVTLTLGIVALSSCLRGYTLSANALIIQRIGWTTRLALLGITAVEGKPEFGERCRWIIGTGGLFSRSGIGWHPEFGLCYVYGTDLSRAVLIRYRTKHIVITPHDPQHVIARLRTLIKIGAEWR